MAVSRESTIDRFIGLPTDIKPTGVRIGSAFYEYDTRIDYICRDGTNWESLGAPQTYFVGIAEGDISGHEAWNKIGFNGAVTSTPADLWAATGPYVFPAAEMRMEVVSSDDTQDKAAGTGIQKVKIWYLNNVGVEKTDIISLNGTTAVPTNATDIYRINHFRANVAGTGGVAVGNIDIRHLDDTPIYSRIAIGQTRSRTMIYTVPAGKSLYITGLRASASHTAVNKYATMILRSSWNDLENTNSTFFMAYSQLILETGAVPLNFDIPLVFGSMSDLRVIVYSSGTAAVSLELRGWVE